MNIWEIGCEKSQTICVRVVFWVLTAKGYNPNYYVCVSKHRSFQEFKQMTKATLNACEDNLSHNIITIMTNFIHRMIKNK